MFMDSDNMNLSWGDRGVGYKDVWGRERGGKGARCVCVCVCVFVCVCPDEVAKGGGRFGGIPGSHGSRWWMRIEHSKLIASLCFLRNIR